MKLMANTFGGAGDEAAGDDEFMPMMKGMMKSLLSKDVLYPSLKDISAKVSCLDFFTVLLATRIVCGL
jgi:hypothetical protein